MRANSFSIRSSLQVQKVQVVQPLRGACPERSRRVQSPTSVLPRDAGQDVGGGLIGLNFLNDLNHSNSPRRQWAGAGKSLDQFYDFGVARSLSNQLGQFLGHH